MTQSSIWTCILMVLVAAVADFATRRIPNTVTLGGLLVGLVIHTATGVVDAGALGGLRGFGYAIGGAVACGLLPFFAWRRGEMGGGDVKLFAAIGALMGPTIGFDVQAATFALGLLVLLPYRLLRHRALGIVLGNARIALTNLFRRGKARLAYVEAPKLPPVVLGPTIGVAFMFTIFFRGVLQ